MDFKKEFTYLAQKYNLKYKYQDFENCFGGNWWVYTHSLYNDSGCFTITKRRSGSLFYKKV